MGPSILPIVRRRTFDRQAESSDGKISSLESRSDPKWLEAPASNPRRQGWRCPPAGSSKLELRATMKRCCDAGDSTATDQNCARNARNSSRSCSSSARRAAISAARASLRDGVGSAAGGEDWDVGKAVAPAGISGSGDFGGEELDDAGALSAGAGGEEADQRGVAAGEFVEAGFEIGHGLEGVHPLGAGAEFAGGLGAAQEEHAEQGDLGRREVVVLQQFMPILLHPRSGAEDDAGQLLLPQRIEAGLDRLFHHTRRRGRGLCFGCRPW